MVKNLNVGLRRVRVHFNFHKRLFSICQNGIVVDYAKCVWLHNVEFKVGPKGRERVLAEGRKNVHAFLYGDLYMVDETHNHWYNNHEAIARYNPYKYDSFVDDDENPVYKCLNAMLNVVDGKSTIEIGY